MARINGSGGGVTAPTGFTGDYVSWDLSGEQPIVDDTSFTDTTTGASHFGVGTITYGVSLTAWGKDGAANDGGINDHIAAGASLTLTAKSGCTYGGNIVVGTVNPSLSKRGLMGLRFAGMISGNVTPTWA